MKVTKTKSGKYTCRLVVSDINGKRKFLRFTDSDKNRLRQTVSNYAADHAVYTESLALGPTMARLLDEKALVLRPSTMHGYRAVQRSLEKDFPALISRPVDKITDRDLQALVNELSRRGLRPKTIRNYLGLISEVLSSEGCRMPDVTVPRGAQAVYHIPDESVIGKLSDAARGTRMEVPLALAVLGMRRGEICAVKASDLDGSVLSISRAISVADGGEEIEMDVPKTDASVRLVVLPDYIADLIREQGCAWSSSAKALTAAWPHLCIKAGVEPFRLHDCRHFFVSYCHEVLRLSDAQIMKLGGWRTDRVMKSHYRHTLSDVGAEVTANIAGILSEKRAAGS